MNCLNVVQYDTPQRLTCRWAGGNWDLLLPNAIVEEALRDRLRALLT